MHHTVQLPTKILFEEGKKPTEGVLSVEPCEAGYGTTLGNALRRVLLSSLSGAAVTDVKIKGVQHEFSALPGVQEDAVEIIQNAKQIRMKMFSDEPVRLTLKAKGEKAITAGDIEKHASIEVVNPDQVIATLTEKNAEIEMEFVVKRGRGYDMVESRDRGKTEVSLLAIDALYSPIRNVGFRVENVRVGQMTNFDQLKMTIETDGTMTAREAIEQSAQILIDHFSLFLSPKDAKEAAAEEAEAAEAAAAAAEAAEKQIAEAAEVQPEGAIIEEKKEEKA